MPETAQAASGMQVREAQPGSCMERDNLISDAEGKGASGASREA
jgi:hypothetical protein